MEYEAPTVGSLYYGLNQWWQCTRIFPEDEPNRFDFRTCKNLNESTMNFNLGQWQQARSTRMMMTYEEKMIDSEHSPRNRVRIQPSQYASGKVTPRSCINNNPYMIEKRTDVSTNTRSSTGAVRREAMRAWRGANAALFDLIGKRVRLHHIDEEKWTREQIDIIESCERIGEITNVSPRTGQLRVRFGNVSISGLVRSEIEPLE